MRVKRDYVIKATKTEGGYVVDEFALEEVRRPKKTARKTLTKETLK